MNACLFCTSPDIQKRTIVAEGLVWAFLTRTPITPGHTLICPVRCVQTMDELTREERQALEDLRKRIVAALKQQFKAQGFHFAWNEGSVAGQSVPHLHLHVVPRNDSDSGIIEYEPRKFLYRPGSRAETPEDELRTIAQLLRPIV
ncbi:HIT domain-containing protein [Candidatus Uhrbacteria bacterium]|nr:HIT domain-containing protein [Candidatus Uhrbacteria bacterium]